jgi:hypothetical protein
MNIQRTLTHTRLWLILFSTALVLAGTTAIFPREGLRLLSPLFLPGSFLESVWPSMAQWLTLVQQAIEETYDQYPFLAYGYDWLAFGHYIISIPFIMAIWDTRQIPWVINYGIFACIAVLPFAIVFGAIREIPLFWRGVDTLFGIGGLIVLFFLRKQFNASSSAQA